MGVETTVIVAVIAGVQLLALTVVQGIISSRKEQREANIRRQDKHDDHKRQDEVADRVAKTAKQAAEAAELLVKAQRETIARTEEVARVAREADRHISEQLAAIHVLVNSDMTAARTNERDQTVLTVLALKRVQLLGAQLGLPADPDAQDAIDTAETRVLELNQILEDRRLAQAQIDAELARRGEALARRASDKGETQPPIPTATDIADAAVRAVADKLAQ